MQLVRSIFAAFGAVALLASTSVDAHLKTVQPPARNNPTDLSSGSCCVSNTREAVMEDNFKCDTGADISTRKSATGTTLKEGHEYALSINLAVNHAGRVYHGLEEYTNAYAANTAAPPVDTTILLYDQAINTANTGNKASTYRMVLGAACDNCGWYSWYDTTGVGQTTWTSCSDVTVEPLDFVVYYADTEANVATTANVAMTGQTVTGMIYPNVPMPSISSNGNTVNANENQIKHIEFTLECPAGVTDEWCVTTPGVDPTYPFLFNNAPPTETAAPGINTDQLPSSPDSPYTVRANVCFLLEDYKGNALNRCRAYTGTFIVNRPVYCIKPSETATTPYACLPATEKTPRPDLETILCPGGTCTDTLCCTENPKCTSYTGCTAGLMAPKADMDVFCAGTTCTPDDCCDANPTCAAFPCAGRLPIAPTAGATVITCASGACLMDECCQPNETCGSIGGVGTGVAFDCVSLNMVSAIGSAARRCRDPTCNEIDCCTARPSCMNPNGSVPSSTAFACPISGKTMRVNIADYKTKMCLAIGCKPDDCCEPVVAAPIGPDRPIGGVTTSVDTSITAGPDGIGGTGGVSSSLSSSPGGAPVDPATGLTTGTTPASIGGVPVTGGVITPILRSTPISTTAASNGGFVDPARAADPNASTDDENDSSGTIIGIIVGLLAVCCLILAGLLLKKKKRNGLLDMQGDMYRDVAAEPVSGGGLKGVSHGPIVVAPPIATESKPVIIDSSSESESSESEPEVSSSESESEEVVESSSDEEVSDVPVVAAAVAPMGAAPILVKKSAPKLAAPKLKKAPTVAAPTLDKTPTRAAPIMKKPAAIGAGGGTSPAVAPPQLAVGAGGGGGDPVPDASLSVGAGGGGGDMNPPASAAVGVGAGSGSPAKPRAATVVRKGTGRQGKGGKQAARPIAYSQSYEATNKDYVVDGNIVAVMPAQFMDLIKDIGKKREEKERKAEAKAAKNAAE